MSKTVRMSKPERAQEAKRRKDRKNGRGRKWVAATQLDFDLNLFH